MVTDYPHIVRNRELESRRDAQPADGPGAWVTGRLRQWVCGLHGHDHLLQFGRERLFLRCASCGHESPGWELTEARPRVHIRGDARRHALAAARFVGARRIA